MATQETLLTREESLAYVSDTLLIQDVESTLTKDPRNLLDSIVCSFQQRVPIQSITLHLVEIDKRRRPSWVEVKESVLSGLGGLCYELNIFMYALLRGLGCDVYLVDAAVKRPSNHVMTIARDVGYPGNLLLIDAGCGFPTFQAVDLNFLEESPEYQQSFLGYKFIKRNGKVLRMHKSREGGMDADWKRYYDFELRPLTLDEINQRFDKVFEDPTSTSSHRVLRCTLFPDYRACALRNNVILQDKGSQTLEETEFDSDNELKSVICQTFPMFYDRREMVELAIDGWKRLAK